MREKEGGREREQRRYNEKKDWHIDEPVKQAENLREREREREWRGRVIRWGKRWRIG